MGIMDYIKRAYQGVENLARPQQRQQQSVYSRTESGPSAQELINQSESQGRTVRQAQPGVLSRLQRQTIQPQGKTFLRYNTEQERVNQFAEAGIKRIAKERKQENYNKISNISKDVGQRATRFIETASPAVLIGRYKGISKKTGEPVYAGQGLGFSRKTYGGKGGTAQGSRYFAGGISYRLTIRKGGVGGKSGRYPGRPKQSFKPRVDPLTGRIIKVPANYYYKLQRRAKRVLSGQAQAVQNQQVRQFVARGIPPQQAAQIEMQREMAIQRQAMARAVVPQAPQMSQVQRFPIRQGFAPIQSQQIQPVTDFFRGGQQIRPKEKWLQ